MYKINYATIVSKSVVVKSPTSDIPVNTATTSVLISSVVNVSSAEILLPEIFVTMFNTNQYHLYIERGIHHYQLKQHLKLSHKYHLLPNAVSKAASSAIVVESLSGIIRLGAISYIT